MSLQRLAPGANEAELHRLRDDRASESQPINFDGDAWQSYAPP